MAFTGQLGPVVSAPDCHQQEEAEAGAAWDQSQCGLESSVLDTALFPASLRAQDCWASLSPFWKPHPSFTAWLRPIPTDGLLASPAGSESPFAQLLHHLWSALLQDSTTLYSVIQWSVLSQRPSKWGKSELEGEFIHLFIQHECTRHFLREDTEVGKMGMVPVTDTSVAGSLPCDPLSLPGGLLLTLCTRHAPCISPPKDVLWPKGRLDRPGTQ